MKQLAINAIVAGMIFGFASSASAAVQVGDTFKLDWPGFSPHGHEGPFQMTEQGNDHDQFNTFCVELNEYFSPGSVYTVQSMGYETHNTDFYLSGYSAWIYSTYRHDGFGAQDSLSTTMYDAVQYAIWSGMTKIATEDGSGIGVSGVAEQATSEVNSYLGRAFSDADLQSLGIGQASFLAAHWNAAHSNSSPSDYAYRGDVVVLNLTGSNGANAQDQLGLDPVPEPATMTIWGLGALGCAMAAYRRKKLAI